MYEVLLAAALGFIGSILGAGFTSAYYYGRLTKSVDNHEKRLDKHGERLDDHETRIAHIEGQKARA